MDRVIALSLAALLVLVMGFLIVDCSAGYTQRFESVVVGHHYKPPWTEVSTSTDADGNMSVSTTHHAEEFHVLCKSEAGEVLDCMESRQTYYSTTNEQAVMVKVRQGRWTGGYYMPRIDRQPR